MAREYARIPPCISNSSPTGTHLPPSCCARATARTARSGSAPSATSPIGPRRISRACAASSKGGTVIPADREAFTITRSLPHGHIAAALGTAQKIGLDRILGPDGNRCRDLVLAMIVGRILDPASKLAAARALSPATATLSLGTVLGLGEVDEDELYAALDWLLERHAVIEAALAKRHLKNGTLVLYDVSSSYMVGPLLPDRPTRLQPGWTPGHVADCLWSACAPDGCPVAIQVFEGNTGDPMTLATQVKKLKQRFALDHVVLVGDRGMSPRRVSPKISRPPGSTGSPRCAPRAIQELVKGGALQLSLFDQRDMAAITSPDFPDERLIVCRNPDLAAQRPQAPGTARRPPNATSPASRLPSCASDSRCAGPRRSRSLSVP